MLPDGEVSDPESYLHLDVVAGRSTSPPISCGGRDLEVAASHGLATTTVCELLNPGVAL